MTDISQFRPICLLNAEGKIFFSMIAQRLSTYLEKNKYIDTAVQKAGIPGFTGCLEHTSMIWQNAPGGYLENCRRTSSGPE